MAKSSAEIRRELLAAEERERAEARIKKEATRPQFEFWIAPAELRTETSFGKMYDPTCHQYEIRRTIMNREAASAAGWSDQDMKEGSAVYVYNVVTRRIVCAVGGGTLYINKAFPGEHEDYADDTAMFQIGSYLAEFPGGGDITYIVEDFKATRKAKLNGNGPK
jgi:hypothetical protein